MPFTPMDVRRLVKQFLDRKGVQMNRFKNNLPGRQWLTNFLKRNKDRLTLRFCENVKRSRAQVSAAVINDYFNNIEKKFEIH